jgi:hypothetical protein
LELKPLAETPYSAVTTSVPWGRPAIVLAAVCGLLSYFIFPMLGLVWVMLI